MGVSSIVFVVLLHKQTRLPVTSTVKAVKTLFCIAVCAWTARMLGAALPVEANRWFLAFSTTGLAAFSTLIFTLAMSLTGVLGREDFRRLKGFVKSRLHGGPADA